MLELLGPTVIGHAVNLHGHALSDECEVNGVSPAGMTGDPTCDPGVMEQPDRQPLRSRPRTGSDAVEQLPHRGRADRSPSPSVRSVQLLLRHPTQQQRTVEHGHVTLDGALENRQRQSRHTEVRAVDDVGGVERAAYDTDTRHPLHMTARCRRDSDDRRRCVDYSVPVRRSKRAQDGGVTHPQNRYPNTGAVGERMIGEAIDPMRLPHPDARAHESSDRGVVQTVC